MPPHCDSLDGPVVRAAQRALDAGNVALVLPFVPKAAETEVVQAFDKVVQARRTSAICREVESGDATALEEALVTALREELARRFDHLGHLRGGAESGVDGARAYVQAMLGLQVWAHGVYQATTAEGHGAGHAHDPRHTGEIAHAA
jgi:hypothetical protein